MQTLANVIDTVREYSKTTFSLVIACKHAFSMFFLNTTIRQHVTKYHKEDASLALQSCKVIQKMYLCCTPSPINSNSLDNFTISSRNLLQS